MALRLPLLAVVALLACLTPSRGEDWPTFRHDARRSASSEQKLAAKLHLQWSRRLPRLEPAWLDQPKMQHDDTYEPVVAGRRLFVASTYHDTLTAYDTRTGRELWSFPTDGPVRCPPAVWEGRVYAAADDGHLYCVEAESGKLLWKFRGGPSDRKVLGNERLISTWPARGGPVVADGTVYFAAGIWPFMGIFLHAVDAHTGKAVWTTDGDGSMYIKQPHNADSFAGVAPQGPLVVVGDRLLVPGGRSVPACYDRRTGKFLYYYLAENGKRGGGSEVAADRDFFCNGGAVFHLETGQYLGPAAGRVVLSPDHLFAAAVNGCKTYDLKTAKLELTEKVDRKGDKTRTAKWTVAQIGSAQMIGNTALIQAGGRLYHGVKGKVRATELPTSPEPYEPCWEAAVEGTPGSIIAADDRLFVVTDEGWVHCFGAEEAEAKKYDLDNESAAPADRWTRHARELLNAAGEKDGYAVVWGAGSGRLVMELAAQSDLRLIVVEPDAEKARGLRDLVRRRGLSRQRVSVFHADPLAFPLPPYLATLATAESFPPEGTPLDRDLVQKVFGALRPYGGSAFLPLSGEQRGRLGRLVKDLDLAGAKVSDEGGWVGLRREGALPGAADWTHEHADAANTRVSKDSIVKAPLGLLWFGGSSNDAVLPRHGHGPQPQVVEGRLIIEGVNLMRAMDIYTGRILWEAPLPGVGAYFNNLAHQPGANAAGTNFISTPDGVYVAYGTECLRLDLDTGAVVGRFKLPADGQGKAPRWGYLNVAGDYLIGGAEPLMDEKLAKDLAQMQKGKPTDDKDTRDTKDPKDSKDTKEPSAVAKALAKLKWSENDNLTSSKRLVVMERRTGKVLWSAESRLGFRHNAVCVGGGRLYAIDRLSGPQVSRLKRRGEEPPCPARLVAFDLTTGKEVWATEEDVFGTWLSYSAEKDVVVEAGRVARDTLNDEPKGMRAYRAGGGDVLWHDAKLLGPAMLHGDRVLMAGSACDLLTGKPVLRKDPLSGEDVPWTWTRAYGCNTPMASQHLMTFRSGAAGYFDLCRDGGTGNLGGFRSSCTNNLVVAGGVLTAPDYTRTCTCSYQNQTSLALVPTADAEMWTYFPAQDRKGPIRRLGLNLGAPGDRKDDDGTLWIDYPVTGGTSPRVTVKTTPAKPEIIRRHSSVLGEEKLNWVGSSAAVGLTSLAVNLTGTDAKERTYTVRLHFAELEDVAEGQRVIDVTLQGEKVLDRFDVAREAGGRYRPVVREFKGVKVKGDLTLTLTPAAGSAIKSSLLNGIEVVAEGW